MSEIAKVNEKSNSSITLRPFRYRYAITSEQYNDMCDDIYNDLVGLLGYYNVSGNLAVSGTIRELWSDFVTDKQNSFGSSASGYTETISVASGVLSHYTTFCNVMDNNIYSMFRYGIYS